MVSYVRIIIILIYRIWCHSGKNGNLPGHILVHISMEISQERFGRISMKRASVVSHGKGCSTILGMLVKGDVWGPHGVTVFWVANIYAKALSASCVGICLIFIGALWGNCILMMGKEIREEISSQQGPTGPQGQSPGFEPAGLALGWCSATPLSSLSLAKVPLWFISIFI